MFDVLATVERCFADRQIDPEHRGEFSGIETFLPKKFNIDGFPSFQKFLKDSYYGILIESKNKRRLNRGTWLHLGTWEPEPELCFNLDVL